jgi:hypothetical protein
MSYSLEKDISDGTFNVKALNEQMTRINNRIMFAIDELKTLDDDFRLTLRFIVKSFQTTHSSIVAILRYQNEEKYDSDEKKKTVLLYGPDAMSLVREQIEKVFMVTLLCHDPELWTKAYLKDDWRRLYEHLLHNKIETNKLERFSEYHNEIAPEILEKMRAVSHISLKEKEAIEFRYFNTGKLPLHLKGSDVPTFPTPGRTVQILKDTACEKFLRRLYKEYKYISGYTHAGQLKLQILMMSDRLFGKKFSEDDKEKYYETQILQPAVLTSYISNLSACTEILRYMPNRIDIIAEIVKQWEVIKSGSHLAIALWDLRAHNFFSYGNFSE